MAEAEQFDAKELRTINVDLAKGGTLSDWGNQIAEPIRREIAAGRIAMFIVIIAGISLFFLIYDGFRVIFSSMDKPDNARLLVNESVIPLLEKIATFFTTVFGPLLAFILGYYFGQRQAQRRSGD